MRYPLRLALRPSRRLTALLAALHAAALGALFPLSTPLWVRLAAGILVLASAAASIRRHGLLAAPDSVRGLLLHEGGSAEGESRKAGRFDAAVSAQSTVFPWIVVLLLRKPASRRMIPVVMLPDSLSADEWRGLRAWLRWRCAGANGT